MEELKAGFRVAGYDEYNELLEKLDEDLLKEQYTIEGLEVMLLFFKYGNLTLSYYTMKDANDHNAAKGAILELIENKLQWMMLKKKNLCSESGEELAGELDRKMQSLKDLLEEYKLHKAEMKMSDASEILSRSFEI